MKYLNLRKWPVYMLMLLSLVLAGFLAIPGTLAVMVDVTPPVVNTFVPDPALLEETPVYILVKKTVTSSAKEPIGPEGFTFELTNTATDERFTAVSGVNGQAMFTLSFSGLDAGSHRYQLREINDGREGVTYSELVYDVQVDVALTDDDVLVTTFLNGALTEQCVAAFENLYESDMPDMGDHRGTAVYAALLLVSMTGAVLLLRVLRRRMS